jgi:hypothetical protein
MAIPDILEEAYNFLNRLNTGLAIDADGTVTLTVIQGATGSRPRLDHQKILQPGAPEAVARLASFFPTAFITGQTPEMLLPEVVPAPYLSYRFGYGVWRPGDQPQPNKVASKVERIWAFGQRRGSAPAIPALRMLGVGFVPLPTGATLFCDFRSQQLKEAARTQIFAAGRYLARYGIGYHDLDGVAVEFFGGERAPTKAGAAVEWAGECGLNAVMVAGDTQSDAAMAEALHEVGVDVLFAAVGGRIRGDLAIANPEEMTQLLQRLADEFNL